eukprot:scaffold251712_cov33-Tisochrysis_lutea.AAC.4
MRMCATQQHGCVDNVNKPPSSNVVSQQPEWRAMVLTTQKNDRTSAQPKQGGQRDCRFSQGCCAPRVVKNAAQAFAAGLYPPALA